MQFIIISKKEKFKEGDLNRAFLNFKFAPSLIAEESVKIEINNFIVYLYPYNHIINEKEGYSYYADSNKILIANGLFNVDNVIRNDYIEILFDNLKEDSDLLGDYQLILIDKNGNGFFKTPQFGLRQLFYYEDETCTVLSTELKLIVDGLEKFKEKPFVENYDSNFIYDSTFREWGKRKYPKSTIFKDIKRISPHDEKYFEDGKIVIKEKEKIEIPESFEEEFLKNRKSLYDKYYKNLIKFSEENLAKIQPTTEKIRVGLTGGFDSRLSVAILKPICDKVGIDLQTFTGGVDDHPDVILAKQVAKCLDLNYTHSIPQDGKQISPQIIDQYMFSFYRSQGDFNSNNLPEVSRKIPANNLILHYGNDAYKRHDMNLLYSANRWSARRRLYMNMFFFPLFYTEQEVYFALSYAKNNENSKEFIYELLNRSNPKLLKIPFVGKELPCTEVKAYASPKKSKFHEKIPFLWDYNLVKDKLNPILTKHLNKKIGFKGKFFLKVVGLNELDFFLNPKILRIIKKYRKKKISMKKMIKMLLKEKKSNIFIKQDKFIKLIKNDSHKKTKSIMIILMDYASVADMHSFEEIEKTVDFDKIKNPKRLVE
ncbi:MAG: hypothetical protein FWE58_01140 [Methanobrevibacter sp.]|nr:hypothetical protein [Methanobrevibacter sp.]